jgi:hypothetical protein
LYQFTLRLNQGIGNHVLEIEVHEEGGYVQAEESPVVVEVRGPAE